MAPIRYSLHYEDYSEHLMSRFGKLLQMQSLVDMTLMCSSHTLRVHKAVLAASSAYFQEVLQKQTGEPLIILKMRFSVLKCLVEFMYCGKTQCLEENLDELVSAAQFLKIKGLSKVTKEGLGITSHGDLPVFTPPVVINRPPQSFIDLHTQDSEPKPFAPPQLPAAAGANQPVDSMGRPNKDMVVRIPFDIENGGGAGAAGPDYPGGLRAIRPRRGRPSVKRSGSGWDGTGALGRAAERALLRREQDSRKAIHQLKHLQTRHLQDYMDRVTLSQAVNSICGPETAGSQNYMNISNDLMYTDQSSNVLEPTAYTKDGMGSETTPSSFTNSACSSANDGNTGISSAMSQYVNALKSAGLPTDLPILFESGDGSYINVNEQVLLDMVQSSEIQYEVIEQPNIIEKVADPSEIKSIDDLSKSIERGEMMLGAKNYSDNYPKDSTQFSQEDAINSLNAILPDNLESFGEQQNYVVMDSRLQESNNTLDNMNTHDLSCIDGDMQFFTKSMSDDIKKYYEDQQLNESRVNEQLCPTSTALDTNFNISLLDTKSALNTNQFNSLNTDDLRRNEDCYDFGLQLPQSTDFKEDALDCLISPKRNDENTDYNATQLDKNTKERDDIIKDLMNIEDRLNVIQNNSSDDDVNKYGTSANVQDFNAAIEFTNNENVCSEKGKTDMEMSSNSLQWHNIDISDKENENVANENTRNNKSNSNNHEDNDAQSGFDDSVIDLTDQMKVKDQWGEILNENETINDENEPLEATDNATSTLEEDIPFAVGLLPLKQVPPTESSSLLKRKSSIDMEVFDTINAKCLKRKVKYKNM
ncbi:bromodomain-containing protein DDB_G0270170 [Amyelois transitella]|uniref:bromodomain-containing protein DDB_G0270170 n=1 Tax=Amyelois transitella TaxID=680683 RepID=UPI0029907255|nr:bromodomain-containing protein DDB_G0270170 [Amyelois transitella]